jgi:type I restriction enzyme, S subunit
MSFSRYPSYKYAGVEWLGQVPNHWDVCALSYRYDVKLGKMLDEKRISGDYLFPYLRNVDVQWGRISTSDLPQMDFAGDELVRYSLRPGDLLVCEGGEVGRAAVWEGQLAQCCYQKALHRLRPYDGAHDIPKYLFYLLRAASSTGLFAESGGKSTIAHLTAEAFRRYRFSFPPAHEQQAIATFLDRETAKIDMLITEQTRLIELLKEKRQAIISHAVTKGLDPNAPMKNSGVEWLGEVPAHWEVKRLKHLVDSKAGPFGSSLTKDQYVGSGYRVYGQEQVIPGDFSIGDYYVSEEKFAELAQYEVQPGDVLVSCVGTFGKIAVVPDNIEPGVINPRLIRLRIMWPLIPKYLAAVLRSGPVYEQFSLLSRGGTMDVINIETLSSILVVIPPVDEQDEILTGLAQVTGNIDALINQSKRAVALLNERRSALISAAVTGKIDVRGLVEADAPVLDVVAA